MKSWFSLFLFLLSVQAAAWSRDPYRVDLNLEPRTDLLSGSYIQMQRALAKYSVGAGIGGFQGYFQAVSSYDLVYEKAYDRRSQSETLIQEGYLEYKKDLFFFRVGRQAIRWSDSWLAPSLDIWTGRRWNRLFFDPLDETLINPVGVRASIAQDVHELDFFQSFTPAYYTYPKPFPNERESWNTEWGVRGKTQLWGLDISALYAMKQDYQVEGGGISYAFDKVVPKAEFGVNELGDTFTNVGMDIFLDSWSLHPQYGSYTVANQPRDATQTQGYLAVRYDKEPHKLEIQFFRNFEAKNDFGGILYTHALGDQFDISFIYQAYRGQYPGLFGIYQNITGDYVAGLRLTGHINL